ncbi:precorrin-3B C17-methyltransferase [Paenibacillus algorifonticola]|uniref:Precorrin-3B C17-methyltransferase n=1 Tax=Paenibacillus algorifonticola TaxID=684063 RepID=A0A1I1YKT5_9BACL|nr:precorrin-3B C(17)-methyltransferase [Paenibacillus algorifonticola]SFE18763.1 precorrin-3B C17-methyltransferase [Paenibacillus algorifonticola]
MSEAGVGKLLIIGFGPGSFEHITKRAREAIQESDMVIGYNTYVDLIRELISDQAIVRTGMTEEVSRAQEAVRQAENGKKVAVISSGDAGVYGMAGLVYEVLIEKGWKRNGGVEVEVIPGISAINSTASLLGAPIMHDACTISLSDHLTPWELIARRVEAAGQADFVIALYNPRSGRRTRQIVETQRILLKYRSPDTPVGIVKSAYRDREDIVVTTLARMLDHDIGMLTTVVIGNSTTVNYDGLMITPRGYQRKYTLGEGAQPLKPHQRLQEANEPWALHTAGMPELPGDGGYREDEYDATDPLLEREEPQAATPDQPRNEYGQGGVAVAVAPPAAPVKPAQAPINTAVSMRAETASIPVVSPLHLAMEAVLLNDRSKGIEPSAAFAAAASPMPVFTQQSVLEFAVSPGVATKNFTPQQLVALAQAVGEKGSIEYTPHHHLLVRIPTSDPDSVTAKLRADGLSLAPIGDVLQLKACDFCNLEKAESVPYADELQHKIGGMAMPKELRIGFNGCGMACYGAVNEDIGIVYRRGKFDLFLGGKTVGRNAHAAQPVAEGIAADEIVPLIERIIALYKAEGHPNERFHKFFKRMGQIEGYRYQELPVFHIEDALCGD